MRSFGAVSLMLLGCTPFAWTSRAYAQRGGGNAGSAAPAAHAGVVAGGRSGMPGSAGHNVPGAAGRAGGSAPLTSAPVASHANSGSGDLFLPPGITSTRSVTYSNGIRRYGEGSRRGDRERGGLGGFVTFGYPGYLDDLGYLDYPGFGYGADFPDATANPNVAANGYTGANGSMTVPSSQGNDTENPDGSSSADAQSPPPYLAAPTPRRQAAAAPAPLPEEDAVTIVFKDGRPPEQIRNYALTRTTLYITTGRVRTIPVDQIDLVATEKINEKAGVEFQLPSTK